MDLITNSKANHELKIHYSFNKNINSNQTKQEAAKIVYGWEPALITWNEEELTKLVRTQSYVASKLKDGYRSAKNVEEVYFIALDFDNKDDRNPEEQLLKPCRYTSFDNFKLAASKWRFSWFAHTTVSHHKVEVNHNGKMIPLDKFRVWIPLAEPVSREYANNELKEYWLKIFPTVDKTCFQGDRFYYVSQHAETAIHTFTDEEGNVVLFDPTKVPPISKKNKITRGRNTEKFSVDLNVELSDRSFMNIRDIAQHTPIFCPFCDHSKRGHPDSANAFVDINSVGYHYIYCSSEDKTYWPNPKDADFNRVKLFWNMTVGAPALVDYTLPDTLDEQIKNKTMYVFKNDADFRNYCANEGINYSIKENLIRREVLFNPKLPSGLNESFYNLFEETIYMKKDNSLSQRISLDNVTDKLKENTPIILEILMNIFGEADTIKRFLNWNAFILQRREKAFTAWLISTKEHGVGKDFIFNFILKPLYGERQSQILNGSRIGKQFNSLDLHCFLRGYNEVFSNKDDKGNSYRKEWLKDRITGQTQTIEFKGVDAYEARNYMNFILFSNNDQPILLDQQDRRYNVIRNENAKKLNTLSFYINEDSLLPQVKNELDAFAEIIFTLEYNRELANTAIETQAKNNLKRLSSDNYEKFVEAIFNGDPEYFMFEEVFPQTESEKLFGGKLVRSAICEDAERYITEKKVIPAKYMNQIVKFHFQRYNYREVLERLKEKNLIVKPVRGINGETIKAYLVEKM